MTSDISSLSKDLPVGVIQFGEGNFLRAFADHMIDIANAHGDIPSIGSVAVVKPRAGGSLDAFRRHDNRYTVLLRGLENGETVSKSRIITSISKVIDCSAHHNEFLSLAACPAVRFIISNTTEAGIVLDERDMSPSALDSVPISYPGKLAKLLYHRFSTLSESGGVIVLPTELIENNGGRLLECVTALSKSWNLPDEFFKWLDESCIFCSTLVDRIVTGYPKNGAEEIFAELGYEDELLTVGEPFGLWVIECPKNRLEYVSGAFPLDRIGLPVIFTDDLTPYRERKVRVLNGAHTSSVLAAYLCGIDIVRDMMKDELTGEFCRRAVNEEIVPFVPLPESTVYEFAASVFERFENPYIDHALLSISLNSVSKWKARILPSFKDYYAKNNAVPPLMTFSFAALLAFYSGTALTDDGLLAKRANGGEYTIKDDRAVLEFFAGNCRREDFVTLAASQKSFWGEDLTAYNGFTDLVNECLCEIRKDPRTAVRKVLEKHHL